VSLLFFFLFFNFFLIKKSTSLRSIRIGPFTQMFHLLSNKSKERFFDKETKALYFRKLRFYSMKNKLFHTYQSTLSLLNIKQLKTQNVSEDDLVNFTRNGVLVTTLQATMDLIAKLSIQRHSEDEDSLFAMTMECPRLNGADIIRGYACVACTKSKMSTMYKKQYYFAGDMLSSGTKLFFTFDNIMAEIFKSSTLSIHDVPYKLTNEFWLKMQDFDRDFHVFALYDRLALQNFQIEKYRFMIMEMSITKQYSTTCDFIKEVMGDYEIGMDILLKNIQSLNQSDIDLSLVAEHHSLRFLNLYFKGSSNFEEGKWIQPLSVQNLSFKSMFILKTHFWLDESKNIAFSSYNEAYALDFDWNLDDFLYNMMYNSTFYLSINLQNKLFYNLATCTHSCFQECGFTLDFSKKDGSTCAIKRGLFFACIRFCSFLKRMETIFLLYESYAEEDERVPTIRKSLESFSKDFANLHFQNVLTMEDNFDLFFDSFIVEIALFVKMLVEFQVLAMSWNEEIDKISTTVFFDIFFKEVKYSTDLQEKQKQFIMLIPRALDFYSCQMMQLYSHICNISLQMITKVKDDAFGDNVQEMILYFQNEMGTYIEKYGFENVFKNTKNYIEKLESRDDIPHVANMESINVFHHYFVASCIINPPFLNQWPETLWRESNQIAEIRRTLDMFIKMIWCKELFSKFNIDPHANMDAIENELLQVNTLNTQEETNLAIFAIFKKNISTNGYKKFKTILLQDTSSIYVCLVKKVTKLVFSHVDNQMNLFSKASFLQSKLLSLRNKFLKMRDINWRIYDIWYRELIGKV
jgi:hypothetical protein